MGTSQSAGNEEETRFLAETGMVQSCCFRGNTIVAASFQLAGSTAGKLGNLPPQLLPSFEPGPETGFLAAEKAEKGSGTFSAAPSPLPLSPAAGERERLATLRRSVGPLSPAAGERERLATLRRSVGPLSPAAGERERLATLRRSVGPLSPAAGERERLATLRRSVGPLSPAAGERGRGEGVPAPFSWPRIGATSLIFSLLSGAILMIFLYAPTEATMQEAQRIVYLHVSVTWCGLAACLAMGACSAAYMIRRRSGVGSLVTGLRRNQLALCHGYSRHRFSLGASSLGSVVDLGAAFDFCPCALADSGRYLPGAGRRR